MSKDPPDGVALSSTSKIETTFVAPARVNLLGEHTDYTGGLVLPIAIPFTTFASITTNNSHSYCFSSEVFAEDLSIGVDDRSNAVGSWSDYPLGVLRELQALGINPPPFSLHLNGDVPFGAGLSSSASIEVASAMAMISLAAASLPPEDIAVLCRRAENDFVGSPCGIMDQFAVTAAKAGNALLLDTRSLQYEHLPMNEGKLAQTQIIVCNSMVKHSTAAGEYGTRRRESERGQKILLQRFPALRDLGDATLDQLEACRSLIADNDFRRCRHIISDNLRVRQAANAMFNGDPVQLGELMIAGHASERDDFECSCSEIDFLVETAIRLPGCFGARLTGGGFGGCTVNLVDRDQTDFFVASLKAAYERQLGFQPQIYICEATDGAMYRNTAMKAKVMGNPS